MKKFGGDQMLLVLISNYDTCKTDVTHGHCVTLTLRSHKTFMPFHLTQAQAHTSKYNWLLETDGDAIVSYRIRVCERSLKVCRHLKVSTKEHALEISASFSYAS